MVLLSGTGTVPAHLARLRDVSNLPLPEARTLLRELLRNPDPVIRNPAIDLASALFTDEDIAACLRDGAHDGLRSAASAVLLNRGTRGATLALGLLEDEDPDVVLQATVLLSDLPQVDSRAALQELLHHDNPNVVHAAIITIGQLGYIEAEDRLLPFLQRETWLQTAAIQALGSLRTASSAPHLADLLGDPLVGSLAADALARIGDPVALALLVQDWTSHTPRDAERLGLIADLLEAGGAVREGTAELGALLADELHRGSSGALPAARCLLAIGPTEHDAGALTVLEERQSSAGTSLPTCLLQRGDLLCQIAGQAGTRGEWGWILADRCPDLITDTVLAALLRQPRPGNVVSCGLISALESRTDPSLAEPVLTYYLALPHVRRSGWVEVLRRHRTGIRAAIDRRRDLTPDDRWTIIALLDDDPRVVIDIITRLPSDPRSHLIAQTLDRTDVINGLPWTQWLQEDPDRYGPLALGAVDHGALQGERPALRALLMEDPNPHLIRLVTTMRDGESVPGLISLLQREDPALQPFLLDALSAFGGDEVRHALRPHVSHTTATWQRWTFRALSVCGNRDDRAVFRDAIGHPDWHIRLSGLEGLARCGEPADRELMGRLADDPVRAVAERARELAGAARTACP